MFFMLRESKRVKEALLWVMSHLDICRKKEFEFYVESLVHKMTKSALLGQVGLALQSDTHSTPR